MEFKLREREKKRKKGKENEKRDRLRNNGREHYFFKNCNRNSCGNYSVQV